MRRRTALARDAGNRRTRGQPRQRRNLLPTDLVATALGTCVMTIMGIVAERNQIDLTGTRIHVTKEMVQQPIRRIGRLPVTVTIPADKAAKVVAADRTKLEAAVRHCPVHQSLHPDIDSPIEFVWPS